MGADLVDFSSCASLKLEDLWVAMISPRPLHSVIESELLSSFLPLSFIDYPLTFPIEMSSRQPDLPCWVGAHASVFKVYPPSRKDLLGI